MDIISVILPVYNGEKYIHDTLKSVFNQSYKNIEVIVVNDGSEDNSERIIKSFNVNYYSQSNSGVAAARNLGIKNAIGKYITFIDQDDTWLSDKLNRQINLFKNDPDLDYSITNQELVLKNGMKKPSWLKAEQVGQSIIGYVPSSLMVKMSSFLKIGPFNENYKLGSDAEWFFRAKENKLKMKAISEVLVHRLIHESNHSHAVGDSHLELLKIVRESLIRKKLSNKQ